MGGGRTSEVLHYLRNLIGQRDGGGLTDGQLLARFVRDRDEAAFEVLVWRHGPMVLGVGQRILHNLPDAEDVLQATFLTLVRKAKSVGKGESLGSWLYKVAYRIALRAQSRRAKIVTDSRRIEDVPANEEADETIWRELRPLLDDAIARLPEKYRTVLVLCDLQGKSYREAAEQLGCPFGTVSTRVTRARQLLRRRLARHVPALSAGALSVALSRHALSALPAPLTASVLRAAICLASDPGGAANILSARIADLMEGANRAMLLTRFKIVTMLAVIVAGLTVGASALARREAQPVEQPPRTETPAAPPKQVGETVMVSGRVLDPDGKPVQGARLYWPRRPEAARSDEDIELPCRGRTDAEGHFQFDLPRSDILSNEGVPLVAAADGYGVDGVKLPKDGFPADVILRLVKDQPIEGRIVSTEGKPLAGVRVRVLLACTSPEGRLDDFLAAWERESEHAIRLMTKQLYLPPEEKFSTANTKPDGTFRISGVGIERLALLRVNGPGIARAMLHVVNRPGFDASAVNQAVLDQIPGRDGGRRVESILYGPRFTFVAPASRSFEGTVREAGTGRPVAGMTVFLATGSDNAVHAVTDKNGHYRLDGITKIKQYVLFAEPPKDSAWLRTGARVDDTEGLAPIRVDLTAARGIVVTGRVIDKVTGKGVRSGIRFVPLPGNNYFGEPGTDSSRFEHLMNPTDADGRFRLTVLPGLGVLMAQATLIEKANGGQETNPYKPAEFDARDRELVAVRGGEADRHFIAAENAVSFLNIENAVKVVDLAPDAGRATCDLFVDRGKSQTVKIVDPAGKPLTKTLVAGVTASMPMSLVVPNSDCTVFALDPKKPRKLAFFHAGRNLVGLLTVRGDEAESPVARLSPGGIATGRILDPDGQPIAGAEVSLWSPDWSTETLYGQRARHRPLAVTDKEGRFRIEGVMPRIQFLVTAVRKGHSLIRPDPRGSMRQVKPGETLECGDLHAKPER